MGPASVAIGDGFNDLGMLAQADFGVLYCPSSQTAAAKGALPVMEDLASVRSAFTAFATNPTWNANEIANAIHAQR